ncbi:sugar phosphate nucleotidyltransferase [Candidatus Microgenomates bacterium]|nr:sugar phosphate nucleotidyltransferase [Candidatus Microgenomates bacterium]
MKALIIAAGNGTRLQPYAKGRHKSLLPLLGLKIIERIILTAKETGISEFVIVTGFEGKSIRVLLGDGEKYGVSISYVENKDWEKANGISVFKARQFFSQHFVLLMADHIFASDTLRRIQRLHLKADESVLAVDKNLSSLNDISDTTKVVVRGSRVVSLNKNLSDYNGFDTGMFVCSPSIFKALKKSIKQNKNSLSDGMRVLVRERKLRAFNIRGNFWADCDTYSDLKFAEKKLIKSLTKPQDGIVSKNFNRKVSGLITKLFLIKTPITPNIITLSTLILAIPTFFLLTKGRYPWVLFGGLLIQFLSILDGCDGEIARLKFLKSKWGVFFDTVIDRYVDIIIIFGMIYGYWLTTHNETIWIMGFFVVSSLIMDIFTSREIKVVTRKKIRWPILNVRRDTRLLILSLGAITNQVFFTMIIMLLILNFKIIFRLVFTRKITSAVFPI